MSGTQPGTARPDPAPEPGSLSQRTPVHAAGRLTSVVLSAGVAVAALCFAVSLVLGIAGIEAGTGEMTDVPGVLRGLAAMVPWAWAAAGTYAVVLTPVAGLLATAWEYAAVSDRRVVLLAFMVLGVLVASAVVSILR